MSGLDQMSEPELIAELRRIADTLERLNREVTRAIERQRFSRDADEAARAAQEEQTALAGMNPADGPQTSRRGASDAGSRAAPASEAGWVGSLKRRIPGLEIDGVWTAL